MDMELITVTLEYTTGECGSPGDAIPDVPITGVTAITPGTIYTIH